MGNSLYLGKVFGIPLRLHYTWFIIFALVTISIYYELHHLPGYYYLWAKIAGAVVTSLLFFASVVTHELTHSLVARRQGIPVRNITLFIFGGVAQITREAARPAAELVMAVSGPVSSFVLAGFFSLLWWLLSGSDSLSIMAILVYWLAWINVLLGLFNLIPGFPLDGGRVLRAILWKVLGNYKRATRIASLSGQGIAYLFIFGGIVMMFTGFDIFQGLWIAFIGWFLDNAASNSYKQVELRYALQGFTARDVMSADYPLISPSVTLRGLVQDYILPLGRRYFLVTEEGKLRGIVTFQDIKAVPQTRWDMTRVEEVMTPIGKLVTVLPEQDAGSILELMDEHDINQIPVVREGMIVGVIARDRLLHFIRIRSELGV